MLKKVPMRQCIGCGIKKEKSGLVRIVHTPEGEIVLDRSGRKAGRGAYICDDPECLKLAQKKKALSRTFEENVDASVYESIRQALENTNER